MYAVLSWINSSHNLRVQNGGVAERWHDNKGEGGGGPDAPQKWWRHLWTAPYSDHCNYFDNRDYFHHAIILTIILTSEINIVITFMIMMVS